MQITIIELKEDIISRFGREDKTFHFGIEETAYRDMGNRLTFQVFHYKDNDNNWVYKLIFKDVQSCRITQESYIHEFEEEVFEGFAFFWQIQNSRFKKDFNSWGTYEGVYGLEKYNNLKSYRIIGQSNFIDVLTTGEPLIELIELG